MAQRIPVLIKTLSLTALGAATLTAIPISSEYQKLRLLSVRAKHTAGSAANFTLRLHNSSAAALLSDFTQVYVGSNTLVANLFGAANINSVFGTDANGYIYIVMAPNAGSDNAFSVELAFEILD
jgi:hypothetical protein